MLGASSPTALTSLHAAASGPEDLLARKWGFALVGGGCKEIVETGF